MVIPSSSACYDEEQLQNSSPPPFSHSSSPISPLELKSKVTQPQSLPEPHCTAAAQPDPDRISEVIKEAVQFDGKFVKVLVNTKLEFSSKPAEFLGKLRTTLVTLPVSTMFKHLHFLTSESERIMNANSVDNVFRILDKYWNYTNYALLQHLVEEFGGSELKKEMGEYVVALEQFEKKTTIQESDTAASNSKYPERHIYPGCEFSTVDLQLPRDPAVCTLYEVRQQIESLVKSSCLMPYVLLNKKAKSGSVMVTLFLPCAALELIVSTLYIEFLKTHQIILAIIDKKPLKEYNEEYVKVCGMNF